MSHDHRKLAIELFNGIWPLLENAARSDEEAREMIHRAHASHWHWLRAGTEVHRQRGLWMISRVYAELGWADSARRFASEAQQVLEQHGGKLGDFDFAFMEALWARVQALCGDQRLARAHYDKAKALGDALADAEDRKIFFDQLRDGAWWGFKP